MPMYFGNRYGRTVADSPCKNCKDRYAACWGSCLFYQKWKKNRDNIINERKKQDTEVKYEIFRNRKNCKKTKNCNY